jgi:TolA-binding protein
VILKALAKDPKDRYRSAAEMLQAVERALVAEAETAPFVQLQEAKPAPDVAAMPTVAMEEEPVPDIAAVPTVAMEPQAQPEPPARGPVAAAAAEKPQPERVIEGPVEEPAAPPAPRRRIKPLPVVLAVVGLLAVALVLIFAAPQLFGGPPCATIEECYGQAMELMQEGDFAGAVERLDRALALVPDWEHPRNARLWCLRGEANFAMGHADEARSNFERCIEWTENDPELEDLRVNAERFLRQLQR